MVGVPSVLAKASWLSSSRWCWSRKKMTLWVRSASLIASTVLAARSPSSRTPSMRAPMLAPSFTMTGELGMK
jgi:hypothetical protein